LPESPKLPKIAKIENRSCHLSFGDLWQFGLLVIVESLFMLATGEADLRAEPGATGASKARRE